MPEKVSRQRVLEWAKVSWTEEDQPLSERFSEVYFSFEGKREAEYVFIAPNDLPARFKAIEKETFRIAETGFGCGLNFLVTAALWLKSAPAETQLHFISFEKFPLCLDDLQKAQAAFGEFSELGAGLRDQYPLLMPGWHDLWLLDGRIRLTLWFGDVLEGLPEMEAAVDAWYLDGFAPSRNPSMWQPALYLQMARLSHEKTTFATSTTAEDVQHGLEKAGFAVNKTRRFGGKCEMCCGRLNQKRTFASKKPWFNRPEPVQTGHAVVVGAGLAGASAAFKLAQAGWQVTVLESDSKPAGHASGNLAGAVHPLLTADWNVRSQWYFLGFEATLRTVAPWLQAGEITGDLGGLLQVAVNETIQRRAQQAFARVGLPSDFARPVTPEVASQLAGTAVSQEGVYFPQGGWIHPPSLVKRCLEHSAIQVHYQQRVTQLKQGPDRWSVKTAAQAYEADAVIVATGALDENLNALAGLPIRPVKGQVTHLKTEQQNQSLRCAVTHAGYSAPCGLDCAVTGATFEAPDRSETQSQEGHLKNLQQARQALPEWLAVPETGERAFSGRVAFRPATPDHLPVVGPVADPEWLESAYLSQTHSQASYRYAGQRYLSGLYVSNGHGARGLMSVFLAAETIVADLQGEALKMPQSLYHASHPIRFVIRAWRSGKRSGFKGD